MIPSSPLASSCVEPCGYVEYVLCCVFFSIIYILNLVVMLHMYYAVFFQSFIF